MHYARWILPGVRASIRSGKPLRTYRPYVWQNSIGGSGKV